jgi:hypothetical protein
MLHCEVVGDVADILQVHAVINHGRSLQVGELLCIYSIVLKMKEAEGGKRVGTALDEAPIPSLPPPKFLFKAESYTYTTTHQPTHWEPDDGSSMYLRNVSNITNKQIVQQPKNWYTSFLLSQLTNCMMANYIKS